MPRGCGAVNRTACFSPSSPAVLEQRIPAQFRGGVTPQGAQWFGMSTRARVVVYDKARFKPADVDSYEKLAAPALKGQLCVRSGSHPYNLSLFGSMLEHLGPQRTEAWLKGLVANMAREPKGGDTDQIRGVASGECGVALSNSYYVARLMRSTKPEDKAASERFGVVFPNQSSWGTHINIAGAAGGAPRQEPRRRGAVPGVPVQRHRTALLCDGNNEYPVVASAATENPALVSLGRFKAETVPSARSAPTRRRCSRCSTVSASSRRQPRLCLGR